jgi:predicted transcriptional regulator
MYVRMNVILSIRPTFCQSIFEGKKVYEYRKKVFKRTDIDKVYIYASKPICKIVGYFTIAAMIEDSPNNMWKMTHEGSGITKEYFDAYFSGCDMAHAIKIDEVIKFDTPIDPKKVIKNFIAPQNYRYVDYDI